MQQTQLFTESALTKSHIHTPSISASFEQGEDEKYYITLNISSNKFLIAVKERAGVIENFEIIAVKSFMSLTKNTIRLLRKVVEQLLGKKYSLT